MRKIKFKDILPKKIDMQLLLEILRGRGFIEVGKIEGEKGFVILDEDEEPEALSFEEVWELVKDDYFTTCVLDYLMKNAKEGWGAYLDFKDKELVIYEPDKDREAIERIRKKTSDEPKEVSPVYIS